MSKKPRFFCDNCGAEVDYNEKACPHCGRFFASVRCPACGFSGEERLFTSGCPACGYSAPSRAPPPLRGKKVRTGPLPLWIYVFLTAALVFVLAVLFFIAVR